MLTQSIRSKLYRRSVACMTAIALTMSVSSCAQRADGSTVSIVDDVQVLSMSSEGLSPAAARQLERTQRYAEMRVTAAAGGVVLGALAGALLGGSGNRGAGAAIGALAGGALGYLGGAYVANLNSQAEDQRNDLNVQLSAARAAVNEQELAVSDARTMVKTERKRLDRTVKDYRSGRIAKDQAAKNVEIAGRNLEIINEAINAAKDDITGVQKTIEARESAGEPVGALPGQLNKLRSQEAQLVRQRDSLLAAFQEVPADLDPPSAGA